MAVNGYARSIHKKLPPKKADDFKYAMQEILTKNPRLLASINLDFTYWLLDSEIQSIVKNDEVLQDFIEKIKNRIKDVRNGNPIITPDNEREGGLTYDLLTLAKEIKQTGNEERQAKLGVIYDIWRALTDMLTSEWAEWTLDKLVEVTENEQKDALLERLQEKLVSCAHEAPLVKE